MKRNVSLDEISDGKLLGPEDMARMGTGDCGGCCACCQGMGTSAILDPMDIFRLCQGLKTTFEQAFGRKDRIKCGGRTYSAKPENGFPDRRLRLSGG